MDDMDIPITLPQAAKILKREYNITADRMTVWRWTTGGRKQPQQAKLKTLKPTGWTRKKKTTRRMLEDFVSASGIKPQEQSDG